MPHVHWSLGRWFRPPLRYRAIHHTARKDLSRPSRESVTSPARVPVRGTTSVQDGLFDPKALFETDPSPYRRGGALNLGKSILSPGLAEKRYNSEAGPTASPDDCIRQFMSQCLHHAAANGNATASPASALVESELSDCLPPTPTPGEVVMDELLSNSKDTNETTLETGSQQLREQLRRLMRPERSLKDSKKALRAVNALAAQLGGTQKLPLELVTHGQLLAAEARNSPALKLYTDAMALHSPPPSIFPAVLLNIQRWLEEDNFDDPEGVQRKLALEHIVLGLPETREAGCRPSGLRRLYADLHPPLRGQHFRILAVLNVQALYQLWLDFQQSDRWIELKANFVTGPQQVKQPPTGANRDGTEIQGFIHDVVEGLIIGKAPQLAWMAVRDLDPNVPDLFPQTWSLLLDFPEFLSTWSEPMRDRVLQKYESQLKGIEDTLGIEWSGGEDGAHRFIGEDQESTEAIIGQYSSDKV